MDTKILIIVFIVLVLIYYINFNQLKEGFKPVHKTAIIFVLKSRAGFFSTFFFLVSAYLYAEEGNYDFFIDHEDWQYTYKEGWHDYFTSLNVWDPSLEYDTVLRMHHGDLTYVKHHFKVSELVRVCKIIFKPKLDYYQKAEEFIEKMDSNYASLYVRRGDKVKGASREMSELSMYDIVNMTLLESGSKNIFIQTDDYSVVEEIRELIPKAKIFSLTDPSLRGTSQQGITDMNSEDTKKHMEELIVSCLIFVKGTPAWTDHRSNVGRFHKLFMFDTVKLYPVNEFSEALSLESYMNPWTNLVMIGKDMCSMY